MYKMMIVEDDVFYRYEIRNFMDWEKYGFRVIGEAMNGKCALELFQKEVPDLVLTDISMPEMNGIEFLKQVRERWPWVVCIVLSSYDDFNFVKDAMKLGARDYLLKYDLKEADVISMLKKVQTDIEKERLERRKFRIVEENFSIISNDFLRKLLLGKRNPEEDMRAFWESVGCTDSPGNITVLVVKFVGQEEERYQRSRKILEANIAQSEFAVCVDPETLAMLLCLSHETSTMRILEYVTRKVTAVYQQMRSMGITGFSMGVSDNFNISGSVPQLYRQAVKAEEQGLYEGFDKVFFYSNLKPGEDSMNIEAAMEDLIGEIREGQTERAGKRLETILDGVYQSRPDRKELQHTFFLLFHMLYKVSIEENIDPEAVLGVRVVSEEWLHQFHSIQTMSAALRESYQRLAKRLGRREQAAGSAANRQTAAIMNYIEKNYMRELSLEVLSGELGLTPNYLCKIFKNSTGMKLTFYINQVRVEGAKKLLRGTSMKAHEIAETVGFASASYFSTIFKQVTGMTVSEYKDSIS